MKYTYITIILSALVLLSCSCAPESAGNYSVPKFPPIKVNEHTVYIGNFDKTCVYAVDTLNNRIIYQYNFGDDKVGLYDLDYDYNLSPNFFVNLQASKYYCVMVNPSTGRSKIIDDKIYAEGCSIVGNKVCFMADLYGTEYEHIFYDPSSDTIDRQIYQNRDSISADSGKFYVENNGQRYYIITTKPDPNNDEFRAQFLNIDTQTMVFSTDIDYTRMTDDEINYKISVADGSYEYICIPYFFNDIDGTPHSYSAVYKVNSIEPLDVVKVFERDGSKFYDIYDAGEYLLICDVYSVIKFNKETKEVVEECTVEDFYDYIRYYRNGALWFADWSGKDRVRKLNIETMQISYVD